MTLCEFADETSGARNRHANSHTTVLLLKYCKYYGIHFYATFVVWYMLKLFLFLGEGVPKKLSFLVKDVSKWGAKADKTVSKNIKKFIFSFGNKGIGLYNESAYIHRDLRYVKQPFSYILGQLIGKLGGFLQD